MIEGSHGQTNQLYDINWGALDHASRAPQLISCNYYVCVCACLEGFSMISLLLSNYLYIVIIQLS